ncbi:unnamed protein product [Larinioides sclopetarius]|uniref:Uncharacterized protein n=1 Tax=Larinioides sclopetarius TaxID=280406 RepID=A0AAV2BQQ2_9ARAC
MPLKFYQASLRSWELSISRQMRISVRYQTSSEDLDPHHNNQELENRTRNTEEVKYRTF